MFLLEASVLQCLVSGYVLDYTLAMPVTLAGADRAIDIADI